MEKVERFGVSMPPKLVESFDKLIREKGYTNRSEAIRDIIRNYLVDEEWTSQNAEVVGTVTLVYDHHTHDLSDNLTDLQHQFHDSVLCSQHVHLDAHNCLETVVLKGRSSIIRKIADQLISTRGVKHGRLVCTTTGQELV
jgi:CopG family nickel-responsive transcriptional regulator